MDTTVSGIGAVVVAIKVRLHQRRPRRRGVCGSAPPCAVAASADRQALQQGRAFSGRGWRRDLRVCGGVGQQQALVGFVGLPVDVAGVGVGEQCDPPGD